MVTTVRLTSCFDRSIIARKAGLPGSGGKQRRKGSTLGRVGSTLGVSVPWSRHFATATAAIAALVLAYPAWGLPNSNTRLATTFEVLRINKGFTPSQLTLRDGDNIRFCNKDTFLESEFSYAEYNKFGNRNGSSLGVTEFAGKCATVTFHNPTSKPIFPAVFDAIHSAAKLVLIVLPKDYHGTIPPYPSAGTNYASLPTTPTEVSLSVFGDDCTEYLVAKDGFQAGAEHCSRGYETSSNWYLKVPDAPLKVSATVDVRLPPGATLQVNGSPTPLCIVKSPGDTCSAEIQPNLNAPEDVSVGYVTASGGAGPSLALIFTPESKRA